MKSWFCPSPRLYEDLHRGIRRHTHIQREIAPIHPIGELVAIHGHAGDWDIQSLFLEQVIGPCLAGVVADDQVVPIHLDIHAAIVVCLFEVQMPDDVSQVSPFHSTGQGVDLVRDGIKGIDP